MKRLVILAPNWLGDAVMALPAIADVRRAAADAHLAVAARPAIAPLFALVPEVDETIVLERRASVGRVSTWSGLGAELTGRGFDAALLFPNSMHAALIAARAGVPERWGYRTSWRGSLLTRAIDPPSGLHQVGYYQHLVAALGFPNGSIEPHVTVPDAAKAATAKILGDAGWTDAAPVVTIAPGAAYGSAKRWPPASFAEVADALAADGVRSILIGSAADGGTGREVLDRATRRACILNLIGRTDLSTLAGILARSRALITNDSGAMHLAAAIGVPVTAVFGPTDERATRPTGEQHAIITHHVWCRPCMLRECPLEHQCMRGVTSHSVLVAARRVL
jgi:heptosyltransferase II